MSISTSRRNFLKASATGTGGLMVAMALPGCATLKNGGLHEQNGQEVWNANAWLRIDSDNSIHFILDRVEMGQGTYTGITTLVAEELNVDPDTINVTFAGADPVYRNTIYNLQVTGASNSITSSWGIIREAGAAARMMLTQAAADTWNIPVSECRADNAQVTNLNTQKQIPYGDLVAIAATYSVPSDIPLKKPSEYRVIGKYNKRLDALQKSTGTAAYGIDTDLPGMVYAVLTRSGRWDSEIVSFNGEEVKKLPGVIDVFAIDEIAARGVAVVAKTYWQARKAQQQLQVEWNNSELVGVSDDTIFAQYQSDMEDDSGKNVREVGDVSEAIGNAEKTITAEFRMPFLAHATLEPQNCTAHATEDGLEIWAPTQSADMAQVAAAKASSYSRDDIKINTTYIGGGFGRRINQDFVAEAAAIADKVRLPVKLIWSREEDTRRDWYRPSSYHKLTASFDEHNNVTGWQHQMAGSGVYDYFIGDAAAAQYSFAPKFMFGMLESVGKVGEGILGPADSSIYEGAEDIPYDFSNIGVDYKKSDSGILVGNWRSVGFSHNGFIVETFVDRIVREQNADPYEFRMNLLKDHPRAQKVLKTAAENASWGNPLPGCTQGIALMKSFHTWVAQVADVEVSGDQIKVKRVVCAVDCGQIVNPDMVITQMQSGINFALTATLYGEITIKDGVPQQTNFHDYQLLRMNEAPEIDVHLIESEESPTGVGEPGVPPLAAAVANAVTKKTGQVFDRLPLKLKA